MVRTIFADPGTGEVLDQEGIKNDATDLAARLVETVWGEVQQQYNLGPLPALAVAQKIANAVLAGAVKEHADILSEPYKANQTRMPI